MTTNQQLIENSMPNDSVNTENRINIQALHIADPDWIEDQPCLQDMVEYHIMFQSKKFTDFYSDTVILDQVKTILYDSNDDKLGRIKDLYDAEIKETAKSIAENRDHNNFAGWAFKETMNHII